MILLILMSSWSRIKFSKLYNTCYIKEKKHQRRAIRHEFEPVGPTLFKNPLDAWWGLPYLVVGGIIYIYIIYYGGHWFLFIVDFSLIKYWHVRHLMAIWWMVYIVFLLMTWGYVGSQGVLCFLCEWFPLLMWW